MPQSLSFFLTATAIALALPGGTGSSVVAPQAPPQVEQPVRKLRKPPAGLSVRGLVLDAMTKRPIPRFRVIHGVPVGTGTHWQPHLISSYERGLFEMPANTRAWEKTRFRVEAEGYRPCISRVVLRSEGAAKLRFDLVPDPGIAALILTPAGQPAAGASAGWATLSREAMVLGAKVTFLDHGANLGATVVTADSRGRLVLPPECDNGTIVVAHQSGQAEITPAELSSSGTVTLHPWGRVLGKVLAGSKPLAGQKVGVYEMRSSGESSPTHYWEAEAITDEKGQFVCECVRPGRMVIDRRIPIEDGDTFHASATFIDVHEGTSTRVTLRQTTNDE